MAAATDAFFAQGYAGAAIEQIAVAAGVSKVTVYNHFGGKRALFSAAIERECEKMRGHFSIDDARAGPLRDQLLKIGHAMVAFLSRPEMVQFERRIAAETEQDAAVGLAFLNAGPRRMKATFAEFLSRVAQSGALDIADPRLAAEQFGAMCKGFGDVELRFGVQSDDQIRSQRIAAAVDVFLAAYGRSNSVTGKAPSPGRSG